MKIELEIEREEFDQLAATSMLWAAHDWEEHVGRFRPRKDGATISYSHTFIYWYMTFPEYLLARAFLKSVGADYQELTDESIPEDADDKDAEPDLPYVLTTDYGNWDEWFGTREFDPDGKPGRVYVTPDGQRWVWHLDDANSTEAWGPAERYLPDIETGRI